MIKARRKFLFATVGLGVLGAAGITWKRSSSRTTGSTGVVNTLDSPSGAAIKGYDPVGYFNAGMPFLGSPAHALEFDGATWLFSSAENKAMFENAPYRYAPVYGGYCAYGVSQGYLVKIEPDAWTIKDGRLYLNYDTKVRSQWGLRADEYIATADKNWPSLKAHT